MEWNFMKKQNENKQTMSVQTPKQEEPVTVDAKETASTPAMSRFDMFKEHLDKRNDVVTTAIENEKKRLNDYVESVRKIASDYAKSDIHDEKFAVRSNCIVLNQCEFIRDDAIETKLCISDCIYFNVELFDKHNLKTEENQLSFAEDGIDYKRLLETDVLKYKKVNDEPSFNKYKNKYSAFEEKMTETSDGQFYFNRVFPNISTYKYSSREQMAGQLLCSYREDDYYVFLKESLPHFFDIPKIQEFISNFDKYEKDFYDKAQAFLEKDVQRVQNIINDVPVPVEKINVAVSGTTLSVDDTIDCSIADKGDIYGVITQIAGDNITINVNEDKSDIFEDVDISDGTVTVKSEDIIYVKNVTEIEKMKESYREKLAQENDKYEYDDE